MTKEQIYDSQISPLMQKIIEICTEHKIAHLCTFSLDESPDEEDCLMCTTCNLDEKCNPPEVYKLLTDLLFPRQAGVSLIVHRGDGKGSIDAIV